MSKTAQTFAEEAEQPITREWLEQMAAEHKDEPVSKEAFEEVCSQWVGRKRAEMAKAGVMVAVNEFLNERLLPGFSELGDEAETFIHWKEFKVTVTAIAEQLEGRTDAEIISAILQREQVSKKRAPAVSFYAARALKIHRADKPIDVLSDDGLLVLGARTRAAEAA